MASWMWLVLGIALLFGEVVTPGSFFLLFFGAAALLVGVVVGLGIGGPAWLQWLLFSAFSICLLVALRRKISDLAAGSGAEDVDKLSDEIAVARETIGVGASGSVELRGSAWSAKNVGLFPIEQGQRCRVVRIDGLTLHVKDERH